MFVPCATRIVRRSPSRSCKSTTAKDKILGGGGASTTTLLTCLPWWARLSPGTRPPRHLSPWASRIVWRSPSPFLQIHDNKRQKIERRRRAYHGARTFSHACLPFFLISSRCFVSVLYRCGSLRLSFFPIVWGAPKKATVKCALFFIRPNQ